jgi:Flp pilus assembly protein TadG
MLRSRNWKMVRIFKRDDSGGSILEMAFCGAMFVLLMMATVDFGFLYYSKVTMQNAVRQAARYAITGNCQSGTCFNQSGTNNSPGDRLNTIITTVVNYSFGLITSSNVTVTCISGSCPSYGGYGSNNAGGPGDTIEITATYTYYPWFLYPAKWMGGSYSYTVRSVFKNEQFQPPS